MTAPHVETAAPAAPVVPTPAPLTAAAREGLAALSATLPGQVLLPGDPGWDDAHRAWSLAVAQQPIAVVTAADEEDVVATVRCARQHGLAVTAQPTGHGATTAASGTIVLRTGALKTITIDPERQVARVGAGVKWGELLTASEPYGLTGLAGSNPDPNVTAYSISGGLSWFGRRYGQGAHSIVGVDLVEPSGERRWIDAATDPELFWALRGGGGDFGIAVAVEVALHPAPHVYGGRLMWPVEMARPVLSVFAKLSRWAPEELTMWAQLLQFPPLPMVPEPLRGRAFVAIDSAFLGSKAEGDELLAELRTIPALFADTMDTVALSDLGSIAAEPTDPMPTIEWSRLLRDFDDATIGALLAAIGPDTGSPLVVAQVRHLGGAFTRATTADGPAGAIEEPFQVFLLGVPMSPELAAGSFAAIDRAKIALDPWLTGRATFTFLTHEEDPSPAFPAASLERLRALKRRVDPQGTIRSNRPVLPQE